MKTKAERKPGRKPIKNQDEIDWQNSKRKGKWRKENNRERSSGQRVQKNAKQKRKLVTRRKPGKTDDKEG